MSAPVPSAIVAGAAAIFLLASIATGDVVYQQPPVPPQVGQWGGASSRWADGEPGLAVTADAFEVSTPATITSVRFWGRYIWNPASSAPAQFRVTIYNSDGPASFNGVLPAPGTALTAYTLNVSDPGFTYTPSTAVSPLIGSDMYEGTLPAPLSLAAGTRYWMSIAGVAPSSGLPWAWTHSDIDSLGQGEYNVFSAESWWVYSPAVNIRGRAWALIGVPAPGAAGLLVLGGMVGGRRRR